MENFVARQRAGIEDWRFGVDHPIPMGSWLAPAKLEIHDNELQSQWLDPQEPQRRLVKKDSRMLYRFLGLQSAEPDRILRYATDYGVLHLCNHGLPNTHSLTGRNCIPRISTHCACDVVIVDGWTIEPLDVWRGLSMQANALLDLAVEIGRGESGSHDLWSQLPFFLDYDDPGEATFLPPQPDPEIARWLLTHLVDTWLDWAETRPSFTWGDDGPIVKYGPIGLFGALAVQIASRIGVMKPIAICSICREEYEVSRQPKRGQRNYCPTCRKGNGPNKLAKQDQRARDMKKNEAKEAND